MDDLSHLKNQSNKFIYTNGVLLGVLRYVPVKRKEGEDYDENLRKAFKFEKLGGDKTMRSCIDVIEDTEWAIIEFFTNGLCIEREQIAHGEKYLRLYGILNAVYIQFLAILELMELLKVPDKSSWSKKLKALKVHDVRNKLASHTANFKSGDEITSFKLVHVSLDKWGRSIAIVPDSKNEKYEEINLVKIITEYNDQTEILLDLICQKAIKSLFRNDGEHRRWLISHYEYAKNRKFDYSIFKSSLGKEL